MNLAVGIREAGTAAVGKSQSWVVNSRERKQETHVEQKEDFKTHNISELFV